MLRRSAKKRSQGRRVRRFDEALRVMSEGKATSKHNASSSAEARPRPEMSRYVTVRSKGRAVWCACKSPALAVAVEAMAIDCGVAGTEDAALELAPLPPPKSALLLLPAALP